MRIEEMPGCCTAHVLFDLGGSRHAMYRGAVITEKELEKEYNRATAQNEIFIDEDDFPDEGDDWDFDDAAGNAVLVACTTTEQEVANKFLEGKGFLRVGPYRKPKHPGTGLYLWWLPLYGMYGSEG